MNLIWILACLSGDADGDGFTKAEDCDDNNASRYPDADEVCDGVDNNCNGLIDEGGGEELLDLDGDGYGGLVTVGACTTGGTVTQGGDCNDGSPSAFPGADEVCNGEDDDCDGSIDEDPVDASVWFLDGDGDGWGDMNEERYGCLGASGLVAVAGDCDDDDDGVYPGATETCDGVDEDCDGTVDDDTEDGTTWHADLDGDGYGGLVNEVACESPGEGWFDDGGPDCNDGDPLTSPDALERCDWVDNDCDGTVDEDDATDAMSWYEDADDDGFGDESSSTVACWEPSGFVDDATDCDDSDEDVNPDAEEICRDGVDNNCDDSPNDCTLTDSETDDADAWWWAEQYDYMGYQTVALDLDGDGIDDLAMGAEYGNSDNRGYVYLAYGATSLSDGDATSLPYYYGNQNSQYAGRTLATADMNGDSVDDLLIGGSGSNGSYGRIWFIDGGSTLSGSRNLSNETSWYTSTYSYLGYSLASAGDLDADGYDDLLMGGYYYNYNGTGRVWVVYGDSSPSGGSMDSGYATITGSESWDYVGWRNSIAGVGDVDGDGYDDVAIGCRYCEDYSNEGAIGLIYGSASQMSGDTSFPSGMDAYVYGSNNSDYLSTVYKAGDIDGDGYDDLVLAANQAQSSRGEVYLFYGNSTAWSGEFDINDADAEFRGDELSDYLGWSFTGADLDDDGANELIVGAIYNDEGSSDSGAVYVVSGGSHSGTDKVGNVADAAMYGSDPNQYLGSSIAIGDVDGDGYLDLVAGGYYAQNDEGDWGSGGVWLWLGTGM